MSPKKLDELFDQLISDKTKHTLSPQQLSAFVRELFGLKDPDDAFVQVKNASEISADD